MSVSGIKRLNVYIISKNEKALIERLISLRCVQIDEMELNSGLTRADSPDATELEASLTSVRDAISILSRFSSYRRRASHMVEYDFATVQKDGTLDRARETVSKAHALWEELENIRLAREELQRKIKDYEPFADCQVSVWKENVKRDSVLLGAFSKKVSPEQIEDALMALDATVEEVFLGRRERYCKITYLPERTEDVFPCLERLGFVQSEIETEGKSIEETLLTCESELSSLDDKKVALEDRMSDLSDGLYGVEILCDLLATEQKANGYIGCFGRTESCSVLKGWIPASETDRVQNTLAEFDCAFEIEDPEEGDLPPVFSKRKKSSKRPLAIFEPAVPIERYSVRMDS